MSLSSIISTTLTYLASLPRKGLLEIIDTLRKAYTLLKQENEQLKQEKESLLVRLSELESSNELLKKQQVAAKVKSVNKKSNQPSSKQGEWELKGVGNDGKGKRKGRGKKGRKGAGNKPKNKAVTKEEKAEVERCATCGRDLSEVPALASTNERIIEDIITLPQPTEVIKVELAKKYCSSCQQVNTAVSDLALPKSTWGLNTTVHLLYLWLSMCLPFTRIATYFSTLFGQVVSTAGLCAHVIRVAQILQPVYDELIADIKKSSILHADETGWRVQGKNWWLWVFGTQDTAVYTIDKSRGKDVVHRILGSFFMGVLVVDGWRAYLSLLCEQQSCMAHLLRKIRKLHAAFPKLRSVFKFYVKFRRILKDGQRLQAKRTELGEVIFQRRLARLHERLDELLQWRKPNEILAQIIKQVKNQRPRILTFVEHPDVPCHNNFGEYLIRIGVLKRKVSFGSKSAKGASAYATVLSIYTTCKLRKISFLDFTKQSLQHYIRTGKPLLLSQYIANNKEVEQQQELSKAA